MDNGPALSKNQVFVSILIAALLLMTGFILIGTRHIPWLKDFFLSASYYLIFALTVIWLLTLIKAGYYCKFNLAAFIRLHKKGIFLSVFAASFIFISVPKYYRVLSDETNLLSVARSMTFDKRVNNVIEGESYYGKFWPKKDMIEVRPFLFPFFIHLVHVVLGYRPENVFILNYFALVGLLFSIYLALKVYVSEMLSLCAVILVLSQPIISLSATSASYEIFNLLFIVLSFLSLRWFVSTRLPAAFEVLFLNLLMLANIRHESVIFLVLIMVFLWMDGFLKKEVFIRSPLILAMLIFLTCWGVQKTLNIINHGQLVDIHYRWFNQFGFKYLGNNIFWFFDYILDPSGTLGYAGVLNWLGILSFGYFVILLFLKKNSLEADRRYLFLLCLAVILVHFIVVCSYAGGVKSHPMNGRYYFPMLILFSVLPVAAFSLIDKRQNFIYAILAVSICFIFYHPKAMQDALLPRIYKTRESIYIRKFLAAHADPNTLIICGFPWQYTVYNQGAISFFTANKERGDIRRKYEQHLFSKIYVFQEILYGKLKPLGGYSLNHSYKLRTLKEVEIRKKSYFLRISQVENFK